MSEKRSIFSDIEVKKKMELRSGVPVSVGVSVARKDELAGLYIGDSFIIRKGPPSRLHSYPTQMTQI